ncbi:hypothetical protein HHL19_16480 [Streptomyces sp. R302]|uniref:DUF6221 family protein n=1 Tax=unclassified Streptomyces TaxID=2593676 RepID=UPI00145E27D7|nr:MULTISPECIES: DUF6221 family protein [unclassified Streptomyces]NML55366.1 hypothetical protein [Streptomyces sp. R301]NML80238.1 hypothetical protein [Streptomyces sp. R302]
MTQQTRTPTGPTPAPVQLRLDVGEFLLARLLEARELAQAASPGTWRSNEEHDEVLAVDDVTVADGFALSGRQLRATVDHIAHHHPVRVLADIAAKEELVREYLLAARDPACRTDPAFHLQVHILRMVVTALARAYDDHPDYRSGW